MSSAFYTLAIKEKVWAAQLFSNWTPDLKTEFDYSNTQQDSVRAVPIAFPEIRIFNVPGISQTGAPISTADAFRLGSEISSQGNELHIKTQTMAGSGDYTWHDFTFTAGADHEKNSFLNLFRQGSYGYFDYITLAGFPELTTPLASPAPWSRPVSRWLTSANSTAPGYFGQVKWTPFSRLTVTVGIRVDMVGSPIAPPENVAFKNAFGITNAGTVDGTTSPQPRFSFQLRASTGAHDADPRRSRHLPRPQSVGVDLQFLRQHGRGSLQRLDACHRPCRSRRSPST